MPGTVNSVIAPAVVMRPTLFPIASEKYIAPSGPTVSSPGEPPAVGSAYSWIVPSSASRPIASPRFSVNQIAPSGPATIDVGNVPAASG